MKNPEQAHLLKLSVMKLNRQHLIESLQMNQERLLNSSPGALNVIFAHLRNDTGGLRE